jgi:PAS domain S-box-containing protein
MFMRATKRAGEAPKIKTLRESAASFRFLVETTATPIFISRGERLHYLNHAAEVLTGYTREELLSINFWASASIGVAAYPQDGETIEALLQTADRELYGMKSHVGEEPSLSTAIRFHPPANG